MEKLVCASCPEHHHDEMVRLCVQLEIIKAFGKSGDMINKLDGAQWIPKWQARVVQAVSQAAAIPGVKRVKIICIKGGFHCDAELRHQPKLDKAIIEELSTLGVDVTTRLEWLEFRDFQDDYIPKSKKADTPSMKKNNNADDSMTKLKKNSSAKKVEPDKISATNNLTKPELPPATSIPSIVCDECDKIFKNIESFQQHQEATGHITCKTCGKCFSNVNKLQQHISSTGHSTKASLKTVFKASSNDTPVTSIICDECNKTFKNTESFQQHQEATGHITCSTCGKCFSNANKLQQHISSTGHTDMTFNAGNINLETTLKLVKPRVFGSLNTNKLDICYHYFNRNCDPFFPPAIELLESTISLLSIDMLNLFSQACDIRIPNRNNKIEHAALLRMACEEKEIVDEDMINRIVCDEMDLLARCAGKKALFDPMEISRINSGAILMRERRKQLHLKSISELKEMVQQVGASIGKSEDKGFIVEAILCKL